MKKRKGEGKLRGGRAVVKDEGTAGRRKGGGGATLEGEWDPMEGKERGKGGVFTVKGFSGHVLLNDYLSSPH